MGKSFVDEGNQTLHLEGIRDSPPLREFQSYPEFEDKLDDRGCRFINDDEGPKYTFENISAKQEVGSGCAKSNDEALMTSGCIGEKRFEDVVVRTCYCEDNDCNLPPLR